MLLLGIFFGLLFFGNCKGLEVDPIEKTLTIETYSRICFSSRPVFRCPHGSSRTHVIKKNVTFMCGSRHLTELHQIKRFLRSGFIVLYEFPTNLDFEKIKKVQEHHKCRSYEEEERVVFYGNSLDYSNQSFYIPSPPMSCVQRHTRTSCLSGISTEERVEINKICGTTQSNQSLTIAHGTLANMKDSPWTAAVIGPNGQSFCTAVVFSNKHLLISLHCLWNEEVIYKNVLNFEVKYGGVCILNSDVCPEAIPSSYTYSIEAVYYPKEYESVISGYYDFAVIEIVGSFKSSIYGNQSISTLNATKSILREYGIRGLWFGLVPTLLRDAPFSGLYLMFYRQQLAMIENHNFDITPILRLFCGIFAGVIACFITQPFDVLKTTAQLYPKDYSSVVKTVHKLYTNLGTGVFFKGFLLRASRRALTAALNWTFFDELLKHTS